MIAVRKPQLYSHSRAHSPTFPSLHLCHNSFSNPSIALPTSQLILQPFHCFTYVTVHSPTPSFASPTSEVKWRAHSPTFLSLHLCPNSFSNPSITLPTSQLILQPFHCFTYVTVHSPTSSFASPTSEVKRRAHSPTFPSLHLCHNSISNPSIALSTSQLILQPFFHFSYIGSSSLNSPGEPPMLLTVHSNILTTMKNFLKNIVLF